MTLRNQKRMWNIDHKAHLGQSVTDEEKEFFSINYISMLEDMECNYNHWFYHSIKILW